MKPYQRLVTQTSALSGSSSGTEFIPASRNTDLSSASISSRSNNNGIQAIAPRTSENLATGSVSTVVSTLSQGSCSNHASALPQNVVPTGMLPINPSQHAGTIAAHSFNHNIPAHPVNFQLPNYVTNPSPNADFFKTLNEKRKGKWTEEEKAYADRLIEEFKQGTLTDCENNTTLRSYLMKKLHCDKPMRITKKYSGEKIGKLVFVAKPQIRRCVPEMQNRPSLEELEGRFYKSILGSNMEAGAKMAFAMIQAGCYGYSQPQPALRQPQLPTPHQTRAPSYSSHVTNAASQPTPYTSYGQPITVQPLSATPAWGGVITQPPCGAPAGVVPGNTSDTTNALQQSYLDALSESKKSAKTPSNNGPVAPQAQQESLPETKPSQTEGTALSRSNHDSGPEQEMDMHKLIPSLLREASSLMSPLGAANGEQQPLPRTENQSNGRLVSAISQGKSATQAHHGKMQDYSSVLDSQPQQQSVQSASDAVSASEPKPASTTTPNSADTHVYPSPLTAEEYAISAQQTAIAVSQHSAYSFCEQPTFSGDSQRTRKHDQFSAAFLREHHKRQRLGSFAAEYSALSRNTNVVSASEKSSEVGNESESAIASSDFCSDNSSDNSAS